VTDDELEVAGVLGPKCTKICFDDDVLKAQVVYVISYVWLVWFINFGEIF